MRDRQSFIATLSGEEGIVLIDASIAKKMSRPAFVLNVLSLKSMKVIDTNSVLLPLKKASQPFAPSSLSRSGILRDPGLSSKLSLVDPITLKNTIADLNQYVTALQHILLQRKELISFLLSVLSEVATDGGGGIRRLMTLSLNRARPVVKPASDEYSVPRIHPHFMRLLAETDQEELMMTKERPADISPPVQFDPNDPRQNQSPHSHLRFWFRYSRLFVTERFSQFLILLTFDNAFLYAFSRALWENYTTLSLPPRSLTTPYLPLKGLIVSQPVGVLQSLIAQIPVPSLIQLDVDFQFIIHSLITTVSTALQPITRPSLTFFLGYFDRTGLNENPSYSNPRNVLHKHSKYLQSATKRLNWLQHQITEQEQAQPNRHNDDNMDGNSSPFSIESSTLVLSHQPYLQFEPDNSITFLLSVTINIAKALTWCLSSTSQTQPLTRLLVKVVSQRMLSRSPLVALYPYHPHAQFTKAHQHLNSSSSIALAPPTLPNLDIDLSWDDVPVVIQNILRQEKTAEQLEQDLHGENIVQAIESIIFAKNMTVFNQALQEAMKMDADRQKGRTSFHIPYVERHGSMSTTIAATAFPPSMDDGREFSSAYANQKLPPQSPPVFTDTAPLPPLPKDFGTPKLSGGDVFVPHTQSPFIHSLLPSDSSSPIVVDRSTPLSPPSSPQQSSTGETSEVQKLKYLVTWLVLRRLHFEVPFTSQLHAHRFLAFLTATHITFPQASDSLTDLISPEEALLLCEEPINIRVVYGQTLNEMWRRNGRTPFFSVALYLHPAQITSTYHPDSFIVQTAIAVAGWDRFLTLFLTNTYLDFFFLPPWFWRKMQKNQNLCADSDQKDSFYPLSIERVGCGWDIGVNSQLNYASMMMIDLLNLITSRVLFFEQTETSRRLQNHEKLKSDHILIERADWDFALPLADPAIIQCTLPHLAVRESTHNTLQQGLPIQISSHPHFESVVNTFTVTSKGRQAILQLKEEAWDMIDTYNHSLSQELVEPLTTKLGDRLKTRTYPKYEPSSDLCEDYERYLLSEDPDQSSIPTDNSIQPPLPGLPHPIRPPKQYLPLLDIGTSRIFLGIAWSILHVVVHRQLKFDPIIPSEYEGIDEAPSQTPPTPHPLARSMSLIGNINPETATAPPDDFDPEGFPLVPTYAYSSQTLDNIILPILRMLDSTLLFSSQWKIEKGSDFIQPQLSSFTSHPLCFPSPENSTFIEILFTPHECGCLSQDEDETSHTHLSIAALLYKLWTILNGKPTAFPFVLPLLNRILIRLRFVAKVFYHKAPFLTDWMQMIGLSDSLQRSITKDDVDHKEKLKRERQKRILEQMKQQQTAFAHQIDTFVEQPSDDNTASTGITCMYCHTPILKRECAGYIAHCEYTPTLQTLNTSAIWKHRLKELVRRVKTLRRGSKNERKKTKWWGIKKIEEDELRDEPQAAAPRKTRRIRASRPRTSDSSTSESYATLTGDDDGDDSSSDSSPIRMDTFPPSIESSEDVGGDDDGDVISTLGADIGINDNFDDDTSDDDSSTGNMEDRQEQLNTLIQTVLHNRATEPQDQLEVSITDQAQMDEQVLEQLFEFLDSEEARPLQLVNSYESKDYFLGISNREARAAPRKIARSEEEAQDTTPECRSLLNELGWNSHLEPSINTRVPLYPPPEGNLRGTHPIEKVVLAILKDAMSSEDHEWLDEDLLTEGNMAELWGNYPSSHMILTEEPLHPHHSLSVPTYPNCYSEHTLVQNGINSEKAKMNMFVQSCGHVMHAHCFTQLIKETQRTIENGLDEFSFEFSCPTCRHMSNCLVPLHGPEITETLPDDQLNYRHLLSHEPDEHEESRVQSLLEQGFISNAHHKRSSPLILNPQILMTPNSVMADHLDTIACDLDMFSTSIFREMCVIPKVSSLDPTLTHFIDYPPKDPATRTSLERRNLLTCSLFSSQDQNPQTTQPNIKLSVFELTIHPLTILDSIIRHDDVTNHGPHRKTKVAALQKSPYALFVLNRMTGRADQPPQNEQSPVYSNNVPSSNTVINLHSVIDAFEKIKQHLLAKPQVSREERMEIVKTIIFRLRNCSFETSHIDVLSNPILTALSDTLAHLEWGLRPLILPGTDVFQALLLSEAQTLSTIPQNEKNPISFFADHRTPPIQTRQFGITPQQNLVVASLFRSSLLLSLLATALADDDHKGLTLTSVLSELHQMRLMTTVATIFVLLSQCPDDQTGKPAFSSLDEMINQLKLDFDRDTGSSFQNVLDLLHNFNGSDPLPLFIQILVFSSFVQSEAGVSHVPVTPSLFSRVLLEVIDTIPHTPSTPKHHTPFLSDWFNPENGNFTIHAFLRRAYLLYSSLFPSVVSQSTLHKSIHSVVLNSSETSIPDFKSVTSNIQKSYLADLNSITVHFIPTFSHFLDFFSSHTTHQLTNQAQFPDSSTLLPTHLLLPSFVSLPLSYHDALCSARFSVCPTCQLEQDANSACKLAICLSCGRTICISERCCMHKTIINQFILDSQDQFHVDCSLHQMNRKRMGEELEHSFFCPGPIQPLIGTFPISITARETTFRPFRLSSLYLDEFGDSDNGNRRGQPLVLSLSQYTQLLPFVCEHQSVLESR
ncbi:hypothetical protein BLNAU_6568 [Blattamonas nauphoetae]|uniref:E3 ubiquitin-protein ligase n=1 Tax=Blattamonas nauphoetae TaxID=2049346 RepID=A0ABQ9Y495_9EUKA|nr:hypothetical protein BLNAU_6568 [Blattamonas nauphoetae]